MDNIRLTLWLSLALALYFGFQAWRADYPPERPPAPSAAVAGTENAPETSAALPELSAPEPTTTESSPATPELPALEPAQPAVAQEAAANTIEVVTDVLRLQIDLQGGGLVDAELPRYPKDKDAPDIPIRLLSNAPGERYVIQSGWRRAGGGPEPSFDTPYTADATRYEIGPDDGPMTVVLNYTAPDGLSAEKRYTFEPGSYRIDYELVVKAGTEAIAGAPYAWIQRQHNPPDRSLTSVDAYSFTGPVLYDGDKYEKLDVDDLMSDSIEQRVTAGWLASIEHHFLSAIVPPPEATYDYLAQAQSNGLYLLRAVGPVSEIPAQGEGRFPMRLFVGPKLQEQLAETGTDLDLTVDYGVLTILAQPLFWVLDKIHDVVRNWGWAIIICTLLIKLVFYKLSEASGRSMAKMRQLQPRLKALQDRYKDDRQALSQAMMDLYKREKINPAAGCLPILVQMPFFFAFYWVLIESVEMRQAPFALWINDLSSRDPFFVLPLLMGVAMFFQTKLNPAPPDPVQAKVMQIMPIIFTGFFAFFPAGLVLYWLTNTLLSIAQQWNINRTIEKQAAKAG